MKLTLGGRKEKAAGTAVLADQAESYVERLASGDRRIVIGMGEKARFDVRKLRLAVRQAVGLAKGQKLEKLYLKFEDFRVSGLALDDLALGELLAENLELANFEFTKYKSKPGTVVKEVVVGGRLTEEAKRGLKKGKIVGEETNRCRALSNTPGGEMTPARLAEEAKAAVAGLPVEVKILTRPDMEALGMGGILGVAKGSMEEPRFIVLEYRAGSMEEKPFVMVGKGVTFDTGGLNLKPGEHMYEMHMDMSGGAAVIHAIAAAARLKLKKNLIGLVPAAENMPSGSSYRPGDILRSMSGQTIEVMNTDAEGRILLADALTYAKRYDPKLVVDVATLTGAAMVGLGQHVSAVFSKDEALSMRLKEAGEVSGDYVWPLPLWDEYENEIRGTFGDWANLGKVRWGGATHGAIFLYQFAKDYPWAHVDIAPRTTAADGEFLARGAAGAGVRLLVKLAETA
jgi:leucyl aminopeptidase